MSVRVYDRRLPARLAVIGAGAGLLLTTALVDFAYSHGSAIDPPSRQYSCWDRWADDFQNPDMEQEDPMCWQAWQENTNTMWNWNGLYRNNTGGNHQSYVSDGELCSGGGAQGGRYNSLDTVGEWHATEVDNNFTITVHDAAEHGADYYEVYVTEEGFDPTSQSLGWGDLELVNTTGSYAPGEGRQESGDQLGGVSVDINASAPGRTGQHIVYTIWKASHQDQIFYMCSDVIFPGGTQPPPTTEPPPTTQPPTTEPPTTDPPTTDPPSGEGCTASYDLVNDWGGGFNAEVEVTADSAISGWSVDLDFPDGQTIDSAWNASLSGSGSSVTASNEGYNGTLDAGQSTSFGFNGSGSGGDPTLTCTAS